MEAERYGGTVVVGGIKELETMNSLTVSDYIAMLVQCEVLLMPLIKYNEALEPIPPRIASFRNRIVCGFSSLRQHSVLLLDLRHLRLHRSSLSCTPLQGVMSKIHVHENFPERARKS